MSVSKTTTMLNGKLMLNEKYSKTMEIPLESGYVLRMKYMRRSGEGDKIGAAKGPLKHESLYIVGLCSVWQLKGRNENNNGCLSHFDHLGV